MGMWDYLGPEDLYQAGSWSWAVGVALVADDGYPALFDEESLAGRDRQCCRFCGRVWTRARWGRYAPQGWDRGLCVPCRLILDEHFV
jgi:hypothetical protein